MNLLEDVNNPLWKSKNVIYLYTNKINGKKYVGQVNGKTKNLNIRHKRHMNDNLVVDIALRKHGIENFSLEIIHFGETLEELNYFERYYIKYYNTLAKNNNGYNVSSGGAKGNPLAGKTEEEIKEISKKKSESKKGENNPNWGKKQSEESNEKRRKTLKEQRENIEMINFVCELWNEYKNVKIIVKFTGLHHTTIYRYLKKGKNIGICDYNTSKKQTLFNGVKIIVFDKDGNEYLFNSIKQCENNSEELFGIKFSHINRYINKKPYKGFTFKSVE